MSGILVGRDGNTNSDELFIFESELIEVSPDITIIGAFEVTWGSGPLLCMAGYSSLYELFFIISKFYFDRVDPLEPNFLMLDNIDIE